MELELGPIPSHENVRHNAYWARVGIDTRLKIDDVDINSYKAHLQDCESNPTIGFLAKKEYITGKPMNYPFHARRNMRALERQPEIDTLQKIIKLNINDMYHNTKHIRQYAIDKGRVLLDSVEPIKKYSVLEKILLMGKRFI